MGQKFHGPTSKEEADGLVLPTQLVAEEISNIGAHLFFQFQQVSKEKEALELEVARLRHLNESLGNLNESLVKSLQEQLGAAQTAHSLQQQIAAVQADNTTLRADNVTLHLQIANLQQVNLAFRSEIAILKTANADLESKVQELLRKIGKITWRESMRTLENYIVSRVLGSKKMKSMQIFTVKNLLKAVAKLDNEIQTKLNTELDKLGLDLTDLRTLTYIKQTADTLIHIDSTPTAPEDLITEVLSQDDQEAGVRLVVALGTCCREAEQPFGKFVYTLIQ